MKVQEPWGTLLSTRLRVQGLRFRVLVQEPWGTLFFSEEGIPW